MSWRKVKLGDALDFYNGKAIKPSQDGAVPVYGSNGVIGRTDHKKYENAIIIGRVGAYCGSVAREEGSFWASDNTIVVKAKDCADIGYCYYQLSALGINHYAGGAAQPLITQTILNQITMVLPPLPVQRKIADVLGAYDELIENNRKRIALLEKMARELYRERFVRRATNVGCRRVSVVQVCTKIGSGGTPSRKTESFWRDGTIDWYKTKELNDDWLIESEEKISQEGLENSSAKIYGANTIVMAIYASPTVGRLGIMTNDACTNQAALGLVANEDIVSWQWLFFLLQSKREYFNRIAAGAGQQNISAEVVKRCEFDLPTREQIIMFTKLVKPLFEERLSFSLQNRNLAKQRDRLLARLMSGKIDVEKLVKEGK